MNQELEPLAAFDEEDREFVISVLYKYRKNDEVLIEHEAREQAKKRSLGDSLRRKFSQKMIWYSELTGIGLFSAGTFILGDNSNNDILRIIGLAGVFIAGGGLITTKKFGFDEPDPA